MAIDWGSVFGGNKPAAPSQGGGGINWGQVFGNSKEPDYWANARANNFDWGKLDKQKQKKLEDVLTSVIAPSSPYLAPGYKPGSISEKYKDSPGTMQDLGTPGGLREALARAGKDTGKVVLQSPIRLGNMINYPIIEAQARDAYDKKEITFDTYNQIANEAAAKAGVGINDSPGTILRKSAGASFGTALDIIGAGKLPGAFKVGQAGKGALAKEVLGEALVGGGLGLAGTAQQENPTARDYITNTVLGASVAGAIPVGSAGVSKASGRYFKGDGLLEALTQQNTTRDVTKVLKENDIYMGTKASQQIAKTTDKKTVEQILTQSAKKLDTPTPVVDAGVGIVQKERQSVLDKLPEPIRNVVTAVGEAKDKALYNLGNNMQYIDREFRGAIDTQTGRKVSEVVRELTGNVRQYAGLAQSRREQNAAFKQLGELAQSLGDSRRGARNTFKDEIVPFIKAKQDAINRNKLGEYVKIPKGTARQEQAYNLLNKSTKDDVQYAFDSGLISKERYKEWMADDNYTRVQREMEGIVSGGMGGSEASISSTTLGKKLTGSDKEIADPIAAYIDWSNRITREVEVNKLATYVSKQLENTGKGTVARDADKVLERIGLYQDASILRPVRDSLGKLLKSKNKEVNSVLSQLRSIEKESLQKVKASLRKSIDGDSRSAINDLKISDARELLASMVEMDAKGFERVRKKLVSRDAKLADVLGEIETIRGEYNGIRSDVADLVKRARGLSDEAYNGQNTISRFNKGVREIVETDPQIVKSIKDMDKIMFGAVNKIVNFPSRLLKVGATGYNVAFTVPNFIKDQIGSFVLSRNGLATHNPLVFWQGIKESMIKPTIRAGAKTVGADNIVEKFKPSELFQEYIKRNKNMTSVDLARELKSATRQGYEELGLKGESVLRKAENLVSATETATRYQNFIGEYRKALKDGIDPEEALRRANQAGRENSIDFSQRGELSGFMRIFNPYLPAATQGARGLGRAFKERPVGTTMKVGATIMAPVSLATYWNLMDPERAQMYAQIPEYERNSNLIMVLGGNRGYIKVPLPPGMNNLAKPLRNLIESEYLGDRQGLLETAKNLFVDPFNPLGTTKNEVLGNFVPQGAKPVVQVATNTDLFTGNKIVSDKLRETKRPEEQYYDSTSQSYRDIGKALGVSPLQVQSLVRGYTAGGGEQTFENTDQLRKLSGQDVATGNRSTLEQVLGRFYKKEPSSNAVTSRYYDDLKDVNIDKSDFNKRITEAVKNDDYSLARSLVGDFNRKIDNLSDNYKKTYGKYETDSKLLEQLEKQKIKDSDRALKSRNR